MKMEEFPAHKSSEFTARESKPHDEKDIVERNRIAEKVGLFCTKSEKDPDIIVSVPVYYGEIKNGNFLRCLESYLHQRLKESQLLELNFILNIGSKEVGEEKFDEIQSQTQFIRSVVQKIIAIQNLALQSSEINDVEIQSIVDSEQDPKLQSLLRVAVQKNQSINFSLIDISTLNNLELSKLGYEKGADIMGSLRTFGLDYAREKISKSPTSIFQLSDCDTVVSSNHAYSKLIELYRSNPSLPYHFQSLSYSFSGANKDSDYDSEHYEHIGRVHGYNTTPEHGSPQISVRASLLTDEELSSISPIPLRSKEDELSEAEDSDGNGKKFHLTGYEDYDTALRLIGLKDTNLIAPEDPAFLFLTYLRQDGTVDGKGERKFNYKFLVNFLEYFRYPLLEKMEKDNLLGEFNKVKQKWKKEQEKMLRFTRIKARAILKLIDDNIVTFNNERKLCYNQNKIEDKRLIQYLERYRDFLESFKDEDIVFFRFILGISGTFQTKGLTQRQLYIRDYFGPVPPDEDIDSE